MRPVSPITDRTSERGWHVRLCQVPEMGRPSPAEARDLSVSVTRDPGFNQDTIFSTFAARFLRGKEDIEDYTADADNY
eukprot:5892151-Pleurochrysis_carterae.AAC.1